MAPVVSLSTTIEDAANDRTNSTCWQSARNKLCVLSSSQCWHTRGKHRQGEQTCRTRLQLQCTMQRKTPCTYGAYDQEIMIIDQHTPGDLPALPSQIAGLRNAAYKSFQSAIDGKERYVVYPCTKNGWRTCFKVPRREKDSEGNWEIGQNKGNQEQRERNLNRQERDKCAGCSIQFIFFRLLGTSR